MIWRCPIGHVDTYRSYADEVYLGMGWKMMEIMKTIHNTQTMETSMQTINDAERVRNAHGLRVVLKQRGGGGGLTIAFNAHAFLLPFQRHL